MSELDDRDPCKTGPRTTRTERDLLTMLDSASTDLCRALDRAEKAEARVKELEGDLAACREFQDMAESRAERYKAALRRIADMNEETPTPEINLYTCKVIAREALSREDEPAKPEPRSFKEILEDVKAVMERAPEDPIGRVLVLRESEVAALVRAIADIVEPAKPEPGDVVRAWAEAEGFQDWATSHGAVARNLAAWVMRAADAKRRIEEAGK